MQSPPRSNSPSVAKRKRLRFRHETSLKSCVGKNTINWGIAQHAKELSERGYNY